MWRRVTGVLALAIFLSPFSVRASNPNEQSPDNNEEQSREAGGLAHMSLAFTKNMGQWPDSILYRANACGATMWFTSTGVIYQFTRRVERAGAEAGQDLHSPYSTFADPDPRGLDTLRDSVETMLIKAAFVGANPIRDVVSEGYMEYKCNYFFGDDPARWRTDVPNYSAIIMRDIYPGIDLRFSGEGNRALSWEYVAAPGADLSQIKVIYEGDVETTRDQDGRLLVKTAWGTMLESIGNAGSHSGPSSSALSSTSTSGARIRTGGQANSQAGALTLVYSTYLGGGGEELCQAIAVDSSGSAYVTGRTTSWNFPVLDEHQGTYRGAMDVFVTKLSSSGNSLVYSTYLGGYGDDVGSAIAVDTSGAVYLTGYTYASNFPLVNPYQSTRSAYDVFVTKISRGGDSLIYSTLLGGNGHEMGYGIAVDEYGAAYVTGLTSSWNLPTLNPFQASYRGGWDAFVSKFSSSGDSLIYSTYLGGDLDDYGLGIALDTSGAAYVIGASYSIGFPTFNPYQGTLQGSCDAFITKLSRSGNSLVYSTLLGGSDTERGYGIAVDPSGVVYATGKTGSTDFPTSGSYQGDQGVEDAFVTKISSDGDSLVYSTYLGGSGYDYGYSIVINSSGAIYVTGATLSSDFPTVNPYQDTYQGLYDAYVAKLSSRGDVLVYSTYLGGSDDDGAKGIAIDKSGAVYVAGITSSPDFPTLNPFQEDQMTMDAFVMKLKSENCCTGQVGNANGSIGEKPTIGDVIAMVDSRYIKGSCEGLIPCIAEADIDQSGGDNPICADISIGDIMTLIDYLFITGPHNAVLKECL